MMSAQYQGSYEVEKVLILDAAVTGYAPLIYNLKPTAGFDELLAQCNIVWNALKADEKLPTKLVSERTFFDIGLSIRYQKDHGFFSLLN